MSLGAEADAGPTPASNAVPATRHVSLVAKIVRLPFDEKGPATGLAWNGHRQFGGDVVESGVGATAASAVRPAPTGAGTVGWVARLMLFIGSSRRV